MNWFTTPLVGLDLGSRFARGVTRKEGIGYNQANILTKDIASQKYTAIGDAAAKLCPANRDDDYTCVQPIVRGKVQDYDATKVVVNHIVSACVGRVRVRRPTIVMAAPTKSTTAQLQTYRDVVRSSVGARKVHLVPTVVLDALGNDIDITEPTGRLIIHLGASSTEIAVISLGGVVVSRSVSTGGDAIDAALQDYFASQHQLVSGIDSIRDLKHTTARVSTVRDAKELTLAGKDIAAGTLKTITFHGNELVYPLEDILDRISHAVRQVLELTPEQLVADVLNNGALLCGGTAYLGGLPNYIKKITGVSARLSDSPATSPALGLQVVLQHVHELNRADFYDDF